MAHTPWVSGRARRCGADGLQIRGAQRADRMTHGFEVVDDVQVLEALRFAERPRRKRPATVGELHAILFDPPGHRDGGPVQGRRDAGRGAAVVLRCMSDGFVRAHRVAAHTMDIEGGGRRAADRDAETDVCPAHIRHQSEHGRTVEIPRCPAASAPWGAVIACHQSRSETAKTAPPWTALSTESGGGFYRVINLNVVCDLQIVRPFDNAV